VARRKAGLLQSAFDPRAVIFSAMINAIAFFSINRI
jgi:hypothetical protein